MKKRCVWGKMRIISSIIACLLMLGGFIILICLLPAWFWGAVLGLLLIAIGCMMLLAWRC